MRAALETRLLPVLPYWQWWTSELRAMVPKRWILRPARPQVRIRLLANAIEVERSDAGRLDIHRDERTLAALDEAGWQELASLCREGTVILLLPPSQILDLDLRLPRATLRSLDDALRFQLIREAPLEPEALRWTRYVERVTPSDVHVRVRLARRIDIDGLARRFTLAGLPAPAVGADGPNGIDLFERGERIEPGSETIANRRAAWAALLLILSIPLTTMAIAALRTNAAEQQMSLLAESASERTRSLSRLRAAGATARDLAVIANREPLSAVIERLAANLPQGAWLGAVRVTPGDGVVADIIVADPAMLETYAIIDQRSEGEGKFRVTVSAAR